MLIDFKLHFQDVLRLPVYRKNAERGISVLLHALKRSVQSSKCKLL